MRERIPLASHTSAFGYGRWEMTVTFDIIKVGCPLREIHWSAMREWQYIKQHQHSNRQPFHSQWSEDAHATMGLKL